MPPIRALAFVVALVGFGEPAGAQEPAPPPPEASPSPRVLLPLKGRQRPATVLQRTRARLYRASSPSTWETLQVLVRDLGLSVESRDQQAQVLTTTWQSLSRQRRNGLEPQSLEAGTRAEEFQLNLFVSPFVEPARVYVDAVTQSRGARPRTRYAFEPVAVWFFDRLAERMGEEGRPVPVTWVSGDEMSDAQDGHLECTPSPAADGAKRGIEEPKKLVSRPPIFPGRDRGRSGTVLLEALIGADGAVQHLTVLDAPAETRMAVAAASAVSLWRYQPARLQGCPVATSMKVTVNFHSEISLPRIR